MHKIPENMHYDIKRKVGVIMQQPNGSCKEANVISWGGHKAKMDIRVWDSTGTHPYKGMTLTDAEKNKMLRAYLKWRSEHNRMDVYAEPLYKAGRYAVYDVLEVLSGFSMGFRKELTVSSWMNGAPNIELRAWKEGHRGRGDGISLTIEEADNMVQLLLADRDSAKKPVLKEVMQLDTEPHQRKRIRCTFRAGEEIDVIAKISEGENGPEVITYIENYAGYPSLDAFVPEAIAKAVKDEAARQVIGKVTEKKAAPKKPAAKKTSKDFCIRSVSPEMLSAKTFGERIAASIKQSGISQAELSRRTGISVATPAYWMKQSKPEFTITHNLNAVAKVLGVKARWLATGKGPILRDASDQMKPEVPSVKLVKESAAKAEKLPDKQEAKPAAVNTVPDVQIVPDSEPEVIEAETAAEAVTDLDVPKAAEPEPEAQIVPKRTAFAGNKNERALAAINACIAYLPGSNIPNARAVHRFLSEIRTEIEETLLFGSFVARPESAEKDAEDLGCISSLIAVMKDMTLTDAVKDDLYTVLSDKRFDIEIQMIHSN